MSGHDSERWRVSPEGVWQRQRTGGFFGLLMGQKADGSWEITDFLARFYESDRGQLDAVAAQCAEPWAANALATLLVLKLVERGQAPESWKPIFEKGRAWLKKTTKGIAPPKPHPTWEAWAGQILTD